jgi:glycosyltransferase involved in cell wall biosynthesis
MEGLFVQKHAQAVSLYNNVTVLFVYEHRDVKRFEVCTAENHEVNEIIVYFPANKNEILNKIFKQLRYIYAYFLGFRTLHKSGFKIDLIHANVLTRTALIAYFYKIITKTPYVITEHWSRLLPGQNGFNGFLRKFAAKKVVRSASYIMPVSSSLLKGLEEHKLLLTDYQIVENVVDDCFYKQYEIIKRKKIRLLNVTCFDEKSKNLHGLLRTIRTLANDRDDFELVLIGEGIDYEKTKDYYNSLKFKNDDTVIFAGLKTSEEVAEMMQNADLLVQFSNYESAGVVVQEALVSGLPVVSTKVGIAPEYINETNGRLVEPGDEDELCKILNHIIDNIHSFDRLMIKQQVKDKFSYKNIGEKYSFIYNSIFKDKN